MPDLDVVPLGGYRLGVPKVTLERSHGRLIAQPSALDAESQVRRLGDGLDYLIVDMGAENYLQAAVGGRFEVAAGVFRSNDGRAARACTSDMTSTHSTKSPTSSAITS